MKYLIDGDIEIETDLARDALVESFKRHDTNFDSSRIAVVAESARADAIRRVDDFAAEMRAEGVGLTDPLIVSGYHPRYAAALFWLLMDGGDAAQAQLETIKHHFGLEGDLHTPGRSAVEHRDVVIEKGNRFLLFAQLVDGNQRQMSAALQGAPPEQIEAVIAAGRAAATEKMAEIFGS